MSSRPPEVGDHGQLQRFTGQGAQQDAAEAVKWYRLAAAQGYAEA